MSYHNQAQAEANRSGMNTTNQMFSQPVHAQAVPAQPVQAQPVQAQPVQAQPVPAQAMQAQPIQAQQAWIGSSLTQNVNGSFQQYGFSSSSSFGQDAFTFNPSQQSASSSQLLSNNWSSAVQAQAASNAYSLPQSQAQSSGVIRANVVPAGQFNPQTNQQNEFVYSGMPSFASPPRRTGQPLSQSQDQQLWLQQQRMRMAQTQPVDQEKQWASAMGFPSDTSHSQMPPQGQQGLPRADSSSSSAAVGERFGFSQQGVNSDSFLQQLYSQQADQRASFGAQQGGNSRSQTTHSPSNYHSQSPLQSMNEETQHQMDEGSSPLSGQQQHQQFKRVRLQESQPHSISMSSASFGGVPQSPHSVSSHDTSHHSISNPTPSTSLGMSAPTPSVTNRVYVTDASQLEYKGRGGGIISSSSNGYDFPPRHSHSTQELGGSSRSPSNPNLTSDVDARSWYDASLNANLMPDQYYGGDDPHSSSSGGGGGGGLQRSHDHAARQWAEHNMKRKATEALAPSSASFDPSAASSSMDYPPSSSSSSYAFHPHTAQMERQLQSHQPQHPHSSDHPNMEAIPSSSSSSNNKRMYTEDSDIPLGKTEASESMVGTKKLKGEKKKWSCKRCGKSYAENSKKYIEKHILTCSVSTAISTSSFHNVTEPLYSVVPVDSAKYTVVDEDDSKCCVCGSGDAEVNNLIVFCDSCNQCFHQACYGVKVIPEGDSPWYCVPCERANRYHGRVLTGNQSGAMTVRCLVCPCKGGAFKPAFYETIKETLAAGYWCHVTCTLWNRALQFIDKERVNGACGFERIPDDSIEATCSICQRRDRREVSSRDGAPHLFKSSCVKCTHRHCRLWFHVQCARRAGHMVDYGVKNGAIDLVAKCAIHSGVNGQGNSRQRLHSAHPTSQADGAVSSSSSAAVPGSNPRRGRPPGRRSSSITQENRRDPERILRVTLERDWVTKSRLTNKIVTPSVVQNKKLKSGMCSKCAMYISFPKDAKMVYCSCCKGMQLAEDVSRVTIRRNNVRFNRYDVCVDVCRILLVSSSSLSLFVLS